MSEATRPSSEDNPGVRQEPEGCPTIKKEDVETLCGMGIPKQLAEQALLITGSNSVAAAAAWHFEMQETEETVPNLESQALARAGQAAAWQFQAQETEAQVRQAIASAGKVGSVYEELTTAVVAPTATFEEDEVKMVFVVNLELKMGKGKTAAQVAHACLGLYRMLIQDGVTYAPLLLQWGTHGETSIVLSGSNADHLLDLQRRSTIMGLPCLLIKDAGITQSHSKSGVSSSQHLANRLRTRTDKKSKFVQGWETGAYRSHPNPSLFYLFLDLLAK